MQNSHNESISASPVSGVLLAGGQSRRMQSDKATLLVDGETIAARCIRALQTVCSDVLIAGERPDLASEEVPCYPDITPGSSLGGLQTALQHARHDRVCVLPCDLPYPSPRLLSSLLQRLDRCDAAIPRTQRGTEPLIACYHKRALTKIDAQLAAGELRLTRLLTQLQVEYIDPPQLPSGWRRALTNLNHPADLERLDGAPPVVTFVAHSGTGKTTLLEKLIAQLTARGWTVGALKHDAHRFDIDHQGKDSWRMTHAGATLTAISSEAKSASILQHDLPPTLEQSLRPFRGKVDLVLTEGFKQSRLPKIEVYRQALDRPLICRGERHDPTLLAIAADIDLALDVPTFPLNMPTALVDFIEERFLA